MALEAENAGKSTAVIERSWTADDVILYALGVGAGQRDPADELFLTTENSRGAELAAVPSFANMLAIPDAYTLMGDVDLSKLLHASQEFEIHSRIPVSGTARIVATLAGLYDKGPAAVGVIETVATDAATGVALMTSRNTIYVRDAGGFGGDRGPSDKWEAPDRPVDFRVEAEIPRDQALLYRLTGDRNPLHSDPEFAKRAGFDTPILHGMCTYGYTARILLHEVCDSAVDRFQGMSARFSRPVLPGQTIVVEGWADGAVVRFRTLSQGSVVIDRGVLNRKP